VAPAMGPRGPRGHGEERCTWDTILPINIHRVLTQCGDWPRCRLQVRGGSWLIPRIEGERLRRAPDLSFSGAVGAAV